MFSRFNLYIFQQELVCIVKITEIFRQIGKLHVRCFEIKLTSRRMGWIARLADELNAFENGNTTLLAVQGRSTMERILKKLPLLMTVVN